MSDTFCTLYEDDALLVVDKPAGLPTTTERGGRHPTVAEQLLDYCPALRAVGKSGEAGLLHRLDNETSGCLLVAKTAKVFADLRRQFDVGMIEKEYLALLCGAVPPQLTWTQPIAHHPRKPQRMLVCDTPSQATCYKAQRAETHLVRAECFPPGLDRSSPYSLCTLIIRTGVRHQIRSHCAAAGYPLVGDRLYQSPTTRKQDRLPLTRHFLHAARLGFLHPTTQQRMRIVSPLPDALESVLVSLRKNYP